MSRPRSDKHTSRWVTFRIFVYIAVGHAFAAFLWLLFALGGRRG